jgi:glycosyltransferase involved in cell wall biosynthesis
MQNTVLVVDPRSVITKNQNTFARHQMYADTLLGQSRGNLNLSVLYFSKCKTPKKEISGSLLLFEAPINPFRTLKTFRLLTKTINMSVNVKLVIAGDPWESLILAKIIRMSLRTKASVQVQVHGDIGNKKWIYANIRNWIRSRIAFLTLKLSDQIRSVSEGQSVELINTYKVSRSLIVTVPVPSFFQENDRLLEPKFRRSGNLGFIGRIQDDRGLSVFIELISKLASIEQEFSVVIAGDGDKRVKLLTSLEALIGKSRIIFFGQVSQHDMAKVWDQVGVLVSTAPSESFGRTLRESLVHGVPVWAVLSSGVRDLMKQVKENEVQIMDLTFTSEHLFQDFNSLLNSTVSPETKKLLREQDNDYVFTLVNSWMTLCTH